MQLALSSAALPDAPLAELLTACTRRGLPALELAAGDGHGIEMGSTPEEVAACTDAAAAAGVRITAFRVSTMQQARHPDAARLSARLGAPILAPSGELTPALLEAVAGVYAAAQGSLLLAHGSDPQEVATVCAAMERVALPGLGLAWEIRPGVDDPGAAGPVLKAAGERLQMIRLHGGGPEAAQQTGQGIGSLMARLTLARFAGPLVLTPSTPRYLRAWSAWLGRTAGWGCGSKTADPSLVQLLA